jgi:hypothetical protein
VRRIGVGTAKQHRRYTLDISGESSGIQGPDVLADRHQHFTAEMATLLFGGQLVLEMNATAPASIIAFMSS